MTFVAFDVMPTADRAELEALLASWTAAAAAMSAGEPVGTTDEGARLAPPEDTGEAVGLPAAALTVTFGMGPSLFTGELGRRLGLQDRRPGSLIDLPPFPGDVLDPRRSDGDLSIQVCAEDPQVVIHAVRNLVRIGRGTVLARWRVKYLGRIIEDCVLLTDVWVLDGGRWQAIRRHSTPAPATEGAKN